jgi:nitroreductase
MEAIEALRTRRSIRSFKEGTVSDSVIKLILEAAMSAPSANNLRPWQFVSLTEKKLRLKVRDFHPHAEMLKHAPGAIAICGDSNIEKDLNYIALDCAAATENMLLAAHALGLGAVWIGIYPREDRMTHLSEILRLPKHIVPVSIVAFGYPAEKKAALNHYDESRIYTNYWADR